MNAQAHQKLLKEFEAKGGNKRLLRIYSRFSQYNFSKLEYEFSKLNKKKENQKKTECQKSKSELPTPLPERKKEAPKISTNKVFNDYITDYPPQLYAVFRKRWNLWMDACTLKMELNQIPAKETGRAFELQLKIFDCFTEFDKFQKILKHYREEKRVMGSEASVDYSQFSNLMLLKELNKLRASISRRKKTIEKM